MGLFQEPRRRKVTRVAAVYVVTAWLLLQVVDVVGEPLRLPDWFGAVVVMLLAIGLPVALILAWAFEVTPDGVRRASTQDTPAIVPPGQSPIDYAIIGLLCVAIGWMAYTTQRTERVQSVTEAAASPTAPQPANAPVVLHNSIAVLPFENLSPDPDNAYFAAGMHEETLNQLAKIEDLSVIARTTMLQYASRDKSVPEIGTELNVGAVMEGSVRYAGDRVRITAQLIDVATGAHLWSEAYDRDLQDIFAIQSDIALKITSAMKAEFKLEERRAIAAIPTENLAAYAHYVRGLALVAEYPPRITQGLDAFQMAIDLDPEFSAALAAKAFMHAAGITIATGPRLTAETQTYNIRMAKELADRALAADANQPLAHLALSYAATADWRWDDAMAEAETAYAINPNSSFVAFVYGQELARRGRTAAAKVQFDRAIALDPLNYSTPFYSAAQMVALEQWDQAGAYVRQVIDANPDNYFGYLLLATAEAHRGELDLAASLVS